MELFCSPGKYISYQSEAIKDVFDCEILTHYRSLQRVIIQNSNQMRKGYATDLINCMATECLNDGQVFLQDLITYKIPLVRYATDDYAELVAGDLYKIRGHREKTICMEEW